MHVTAADVEVFADEIFVVACQLRVIEAAEEQRRVRQVIQRLGAAPEIGLQVLQADPVAGHRVLREFKDVLAHQAEELTGTREMGPLLFDGVIFSRREVVLVGCGGRFRGRRPGVGGHG